MPCCQSHTADFGMCTFVVLNVENLRPDLLLKQGTLAYMAPELLCGDAEKLNQPRALDVYWCGQHWLCLHCQAAVRHALLSLAFTQLGDDSRWAVHARTCLH